MGKKEKKEKEHHVPKGPTAMELLNLPPEKPILDDVPQYNKEQLRMLQEIFDAFDVEKEGFVSLNVIPFTLSTLDVKMKEEEMQALIKEIDDNGSGKIELNEYIELAKRYIEPEDDVNKVRDELREVFMIFDKTSKYFKTIFSVTRLTQL